jgi:hypothetical protein
MDALREFLTDKTGWFGAIVAVLGVTATFLGIVRPWLTERRKRAEDAARRAGDQPLLQFVGLRCVDPPPHSEAGLLTGDLVNPRKGRAVMTDLHLEVVAEGACEEPRMVQAAAPVPTYTWKVTLEPGVARYDVRKREFGTEGPHTFDGSEVEHFEIELRSRAPRWYEAVLVATWYDAARPGASTTARSETFRVTFRPRLEDLLG